jgi:outer membrane protein assembly factor BamB
VVLEERGDVTAYDTDNGHQLWHRDLPEQNGAPAVVGDEVVLALRDGEVRVYGLTDGRLADHWELPTAAPGDRWFDYAVPALVGDDLVITASSSGATDTALFAYPITPDAQQGVRFRLSERSVLDTPTEPPVLAGEDLVMASYDQLLRIAPDGTRTVLSQTPDLTHPGAVVADGIVVTRDKKNVQGLRLEDGKVLWETPGGMPAPGAAPATDGTTVFYGIDGVGLAAADLHTGKLRWATPVPDQQASMTPLVLPDGDVIFGGGGIGRYDGTTGQEQWRVPGAIVFGPTAYAGGVVYAMTASATSDSSTVAAYDAATGTVLWSHPVADPAPFVGPAVGDGVVVSLDGQVAHAYDASTGAELWSVTMLRAALGSPVIADGHVFLVQSGNGYSTDDDQSRVSVHDPRTGRFLGAWQPTGSVIRSRPVVAATPDGRLVVPNLGLTIVEAVE